jgi:hypothetical protein
MVLDRRQRMTSPESSALNKAQFILRVRRPRNGAPTDTQASIAHAIVVFNVPP